LMETESGSVYRLYNIGNRLYLTDAPLPIWHEYRWFTPTQISKADSSTHKEGSAVGNMSISGNIDETATIETLFGLRGTKASICLMHLNATDDSRSFALAFRGVVGDITVEAGNSWKMELLSRVSSGDRAAMSVLGPPCVLTVGNARCGVDLDNFRLDGTVTAVSDDRGVFTISHAVTPVQPPEYWLGGTCQFIGLSDVGQDSVLLNVSSSATSSDVQLATPIKSRVIVGQQVVLHPGCDKSLATCRDKFSNAINFLGAPFQPTQAQRLSGVGTNVPETGEGS
jgi:uncharacterized phage protein (TIGR02218 family)